MCKFCETGAEWPEELSILLSYGPPTLEGTRAVENDGEFVTDWDGTLKHDKYKKGDIWFNCASSEGESWFKFIYCPLCGKMLNATKADSYDEIMQMEG